MNFSLGLINFLCMQIVIFDQRCILSGGTRGAISGTIGISVIFYQSGILSGVYFIRIQVDIIKFE